MSEPFWETRITKIEPNRIYVRGYRIDKLMEEKEFIDGIYLVIFGTLPDERVKKVLNAILLSCIDHGVTPPSTLVARSVTSTGNPLHCALAAGILTIYKYHGGAIENAMRHYQEIKEMASKEKKRIEEVAEEYVRQKLERKEIIFGFGHRYHTDDPRTKKLFKIAEEEGFYRDYLKIAEAIKNAIKKIKGREIPINVDGAIAALLCELGVPPELGNAFFILSRIPGLIAHIYEEKTTQKPMRKIDINKCEYKGEVKDDRDS